jgi:hypothetical protein
MKNYNYLILIALMSFAFLTACEEEERKNYDWPPGNPSVEAKSPITGVYFGDDMPFTVTVNDDVPLSTLTVSLYYGDERVSQRVFRVKENGDFSGSIHIPYLQNIPDGNATLEFTLLDTHMTSATKSYSLPVSRAPYPYLIFVTADLSYPMFPTDNPYEYAFTETFASSEVPAYIKTPVVNENGNVITFGTDGGIITHGVTGDIPFDNMQDGTFAITFNIKTYEAKPFPPIFANGVRMTKLSPNNFAVVFDLTQNQEIVFSGEGFDDIDQWWIDPDFFKQDEKENNKFTFLPIAGRYRIVADMVLKWFKVEVMRGNSLATLQSDGTGAIWVIGNGIGKPSVATNQIGWNPPKGLCFAPIGDKKYRLTLIGGEQIRSTSIDFKFFWQQGYGNATTGEFRGEGVNIITTTSNIVVVTASGDIYLAPGVTLENGAIYEFIIDVSAGRTSAVLTVTKK